MGSFIDWSKTTKSKDYRGSGSFATFMIIGRLSSLSSPRRPRLATLAAVTGMLTRREPARP